MKTNYFAALTTIVLATALNQSIMQVQSPQLVKRSMLRSIQLPDSAPPPVNGAPDDRGLGGGTRISPLKSGALCVYDSSCSGLIA